MPRGPKSGHSEKRGDPILTIWKKSADPKPEFSGTGRHKDFRFTCACGYESTVTMDHTHLKS